MSSQELKTKVHFYLDSIARAVEEVNIQLTLITRYQEILLEEVNAITKIGPRAVPRTTPAEDSKSDSKSPHKGDCTTY